LHAYRNLTTGRTVARAKIVELLDAQVQARGDRLARLTLDYKAGVLDASTWLATMRDELRRAAIENRALGAGGLDKLGFHDYGVIGANIKESYRRLIGFANGLADGSISEAQALARLTGYLGQARWQYYDAVKERRSLTSKPGFVVLAARRLGIAEHCNSCVMYSRAGFRPIAQVPMPGEPNTSECDGHCRCHLEIKEVPIAEAAALVGSGPLPDWNASEMPMEATMTDTLLDRVLGADWTTDLYNAAHQPAGSRKGGQFAKKGTAGTTDVPDIVDKGETGMLRQLLKDNGGFTYQPLLNESPSDGFMVSPYKDCEFVLPVAEVSGLKLMKYMRGHRKLLTQKDHYMGGWVDDGKAYIDISVRRGSKAEALTLAKKHSQLAIFDLKAMETVYA
jgi:hypothetical protein